MAQMTKKDFQVILEAIRNHESASWSVADAMVTGVGRTAQIGIFDRVSAELARNGFDFKPSSLKAYHQTAMAFPPDERRDACFSAHETARSDKKALDEAVRVYGPGPTVEQVRRVKANLKAGLAPEFVLPNMDELELQQEQAWAVYERAVHDGADDAEKARLREEASEADRLVKEANLALEQDAQRRDKNNLKKVTEAYWLARSLARGKLAPRDRERLAEQFKELADIYGSGEQAEAA